MESINNIKPLRRRFQDERTRLKIAWEIIEQDYILAWILASISLTPLLKETMIFKGGTALKKCYFEDYRFSQDLDFSALNNAPKGAELLALIKKAGSLAQELILRNGTNIEIKCEAYQEKSPHPFGQEAFTISAKYPWHNQYNTRVMIEITMQEPVLLKPELKQILHGYSERMDYAIMTYAMEEIVAEKIRAILQYAKKLHERGWGRSRARDYYDLWRIFSEKRELLDFKKIPVLVAQKCSFKNITFTSMALLTK